MSRPRTEHPARVATSVRYPPDLYAALHAFCEERELSVNWVTNRAVRRYLAEQMCPFPPPQPNEETST